MLAAPCDPARDASFIQFFIDVEKDVHALRLDAAMFRFRGAAPTAVGSAPVYRYTTYVALLSSGRTRISRIDGILGLVVGGFPPAPFLGEEEWLPEKGDGLMLIVS